MSQAYPPTPTRRRDTRMAIAVVLVVATVAAYVSYRHGYDLVRSHGEDTLSAGGYPLTVEGLVYAASMVILRANRAGVRPPRMAWFALWVGIIATGATNLAHGIAHGPVGMLVAVWPAVALVLSFEMLMRMFRADADDTAPVDQVPTTTTTTAPAPDTDQEPGGMSRPVTRIDANRSSIDHRYVTGLALYQRSVTSGNPMSQRALAAAIGMRNTSLARRIIHEYKASEVAA